MLLLVWLAVAAVHRRGDALARTGVFLGIVLLFVLGRALLVHHYYDRWDFGLATRARRTCSWGSPPRTPRWRA